MDTVLLEYRCRGLPVARVSLYVSGKLYKLCPLVAPPVIVPSKGLRYFVGGDVDIVMRVFCKQSMRQQAQCSPEWTQLSKLASRCIPVWVYVGSRGVQTTIPHLLLVDNHDLHGGVDAGFELCLLYCGRRGSLQVEIWASAVGGQQEQTTENSNHSLSLGDVTLYGRIGY